MSELDDNDIKNTEKFAKDIFSKVINKSESSEYYGIFKMKLTNKKFQLVTKNRYIIFQTTTKTN